MSHIILYNDIRYSIKVNTYLLSIIATDTNNNKVWKRTIFNYSPIYDAGIDARTLINICKDASDIASILSFPENGDNSSENICITIKTYNLFLDFKK